MQSNEISSVTTTVVLPALPTLDAPVPRSIFVVLLPLVMLAGTAGLLVVGGGGSTSLLMGGLMAVSLIGMLLAGGGRQTKPAATVAAERERFLRQLVRAGQAVTAREATLRAAAHARHVAPLMGLPPAGVAANGMLFLTVQVGVGKVPAVVRCDAPEQDDRTDPEPFAETALQRFLAAHATTAGMPLTVDLLTGRPLTLTGDGAMDLARSIVRRCAQLPSTRLRIVLFTSDGTPGWEWLKWLPHHRAPGSDEPLRTADARRAREWIAGGDQGAERAVDILLLVTLGQPRAALAALSDNAFRFLAVHVDPADVTESNGGPVLRVTGTSLDRVAAGRPEHWGTADRLGNAEATAMARLMASRRPGPVSLESAPGRSVTTDLATLLQVGAAHDYRPDVHQAERPVTDRLRVPIGVDDAGAPMHLDLKEAALGGVGPHGLLIGATGSGKSELLRTLVLGLAATHDPRSLNLVLIDFKGGAGFLALERLPHVAAVITNLADEAVLVARMGDALGGEIGRRQELLRRAGNAPSAAAYEAARRRSPDLPELPALVIVCDEFTELLVQRPDLADTFVAIGRLGRSLGVHLLMSSQRMDEGRMRGLDAHLSYRIALKTFSAADSRAVLDIDAAYRLPPTPGVGYLKTDASEPLRFTAAYVSGPVRVADPTVAMRRNARSNCDIRLFTALPPEPTRDVAPMTATSRRVGTAPESGPSTVSAPTLIDLWVERLRGHGPRAHQIWLPPLGAAPVLDELPRTVDAVIQTGRLRVPIGVVDRPFHQRRDPLWADFNGGGGHALVVGGPRSGKSTVLVALVLALSRDSAPDDLQCYIVDLGGGSLASLAEVPHVGGVASSGEPDRVRRMVAQVAGELAAREVRHCPPDAAGPPPDMFLVIDGWSSFRTSFEELEPTVAALVQRGLSYGIHVVLAASRWADVRPALKDLMGQRFELRLGDPAESEVDRRRAAEVPDRAPGRGLTRDGLHFLAATPWLPGAPRDVRQVVADRRARWPGAGAPPVRQLPAVVGMDDLPATEPGGSLVAVGLGESRLQAVGIDVVDDPHLVVWGDSGSGKTSFLHTLAHTVARRWGPEAARFLVVDHRRTLLGRLPGDHLAGHATSAGATAGLIADAVRLLTARLPDADVDAGQLRRRDWWTGADLYVLVDDYDLVAGGSVNPLAALLDLLPHARDVGLHLVVCRRVAGGGRAVYDPMLQRLRELGGPGLILSGMPDEGVLHGSQRAASQPPGRGFWVTRTSTERVQLALAAP